MAVSPGRGSQMSISSPAKTGTCVRVMSRRMAKAFREAGDVVGKVGLVRSEALAVPYLELVAGPSDDTRARAARDAGVREKLRAHRDAPRRIEVGVEGAAAEEAGEAPALRAEGVHVTDEALVEPVEALRSEDRDAGIEPAREDKSARERSPELGRDVQPVLRVQLVLEMAPECQCFLWSSAGVAEWEEPRDSGLLCVRNSYPT